MILTTLKNLCAISLPSFHNASPCFVQVECSFSSKNLSVLFIGWAGSAWSTLEDPDSTNFCQTLSSSQFVVFLLYQAFWYLERVADPRPANGLVNKKRGEDSIPYIPGELSFSFFTLPFLIIKSS